MINSCSPILTKNNIINHLPITAPFFNDFLKSFDASSL